MTSEILISSILEDGVSESKTVASLLGKETSENVLGAVITGNKSKGSEGNWEYSIDGGSNWGVLPTSFSEDGSDGLALSLDTLLRFIPAKDFFGKPGALSLKAFDNKNLIPISENVPYGDQEGFIVSWQSNRQESDDYNEGIFLQRFNSDGSKLGSEVQVNTYIENNQENSVLTSLSNGDFVVTWQSNGQDESSWGIYGQIFEENGNKKGSEFLVNTTTDDEQRNPSIAASSDGSFIIVWQSRENYSWKAKGQKFNDDGSKNGEEFSVLSQQYDSFEELSTTALSNGDYVIAFRHHSNIKFQIIKTDTEVDEFSVYNETIEQVNLNTDSKNKPVVSPLNNGGFVISWSSYRQDGDQWGVFARTYNSEGIASSEEFQVNTTTTDRQQNSSVAGLVDGGFVISWQSHNQDGNGDGVYAQRFDEKGDVVGGEFLVNTSTNSTQAESSVAALKNGGYIITWHSWEGIDGWSSGVYGQKYKKDGSRDGDEFLINTFTERDQRNPSISSWGLPIPSISATDFGTDIDAITVTLEIESVNDAPALTGNLKSISDSDKDSQVILTSSDLLTNYSDVDGDTLSVTEVNLIDESVGSLVANDDSTWTFTPVQDYVGTVDLSFSVSDGTVTIQANEAFNIGEGDGGEGTDGNDNLTGTLKNETIDGGDGDDTIDGMDGDDTLSGGAGSDMIRGGLGNDSILGGDDSDLLYGSNGNDSIQGEGGEDQLYGGGGNDDLQGGGGDDIATGDSGSDALRGGGGSDQLLGGDGSDLIFGEEGDDIIKGGEGNDLIWGGPGTDDLRGASGDDIFLEIGIGVSDDVFDGGLGTDTLYVGSNNDWNGGAPNFVDSAILNIEHLNLLPTKNAREDIFDPTISNYDRTRYINSGSRFSINQLESFESIKSSPVLNWTNDLFTFKSTDNNYVGWWDDKDRTTQWRWLRISGNGEIDLNDSKWDSNTLFRIATESGTQELIGNDNSNWFFAQEGDDKLFGNGGNDTLLGGKGKDDIRGGKGNDHIEGNEGIDILYGGDGNDVLIGGGSSDKVYGESGNDSVEINFGRVDDQEYTYDNSKSITGVYDGGEGTDKLRIQAENWYGNDEGTRGEGYTIDLRDAEITNFEKLEIGTAAILRLKGSQYSQFTSGISKVSGYEGSTNLAIDLNAGEELRFSRSAGINSASGALNITGTSEVFSDVLGINSDSLVDLSNKDTKIVGVESLEVQRGNVKLNGSQWNTFNTIKAKGDKAKKIIIENTSEIDLTKFGRSSDDNTTISLSLTVDQINSDAFEVFSNKFRTVNNSKVDISVIGAGEIKSQDWPLSINFNEGDATFATLNTTGDETDENFNLRLLGSFTLDGGLGTDKLTLKADSSLDKGSLNNVEILDLNNNDVSLNSSQFNSFSEIIGSGSITIKDSNRIDLDILKPVEIIKLVQDSEDLAEPIKYYIGTPNNESIEADNFIELLKGSVRVSGSETISTPDWRWVYPEELDNIGNLHPSGEGRLSFSANDQRLFKLPSDFTGEDSIDLVNNQGLQKISSYSTAYTGDKFLGVNRETGNWKIISFDDISWEEEGSAANQVSLSYWDVTIKDSSDIIYGLDGVDTLKGGGGNDQLSGGGGNDRIEGGSGFNTAIFSDIQSQYKITYEGREITIEHLNGGSDGKDVLVDIQRLKFADSDFNIDDVTNTFDTLNGTNSKLGKTNRGVIDYNTSNNVWTDQQDWDNWSFELIGGSKIKVFKTIYDGSPTVGNTAPQVRFDGDLYMSTYQDEKEFDISRTGIHKIRVLGTESVEYGISTRMVDEKPGDSTTTAQFKDPGSLSKGEDPSLANSIEGFIGYQIDGNGGIPEWETNDVDWIRVDLVKGIQYEFKALGASSLPATGLEDTYLQRLSDPAISLLDEEGQKITEGELGGSGQDPLMVYRADRSGAYFIAVESASGEFTGNYQVTKSSLDEFGGDINTNGQLSLSRPIQGVINTEGDQDWFKVNLTTGERLVIEVLGASTNNGDLRDPWLGVYSQTGQLLVSDNNSGRGLDSRISWAAPSDGNYYVAAGSLGNQGRGSYIVRASSKQDDAPDQLSSSFTYNLVSIGTDSTGDIEVRGDHDWFQTLLLAGKTYQISVKGERSFDSTYDPLRDPAVSLRDNAGKLILFDDDSGNGLSSEIIYQPKRTGRFYLDVQDATDRYDGHYKISVVEAVDDFGNDINTAYSIEDANDFEINGRLNYRGDLDLFKADLLENTVYKIDLKGISSDSGTLGDPLLNILDSSGISILQNDNSGVGNDSQYFFISESNQTIYLEATAPAGQLGTYTLALEETELPVDDHGDDKNTTSLISIGETATGNILNSDDKDWFKIALDSDLHYRFVLEGTDTGSGTLENPFIKVHDEFGNFIAGSDSGTLTRNAALGFKPETKGTYFISASGASSEDTGTYTLKTFAPDEAGVGLDNAMSINLDTTISAGIQSPTDSDWFRFSAKEGETYTLSVLSDATGSTSALPIAITELFDSTKTSITAADGRFTDGNATLAFKAESDGEYYLAARGYRGQTGNYTLSLSEGNQADDAGLVPSKSRVLTVNEQETGLLEVTGDRDLFAVDVLENHTYRFRLSPEYNGIQAPLIDPRLRLLGDTQTFIKAAGYDFIANSITVKSDSVIVSDSNNTEVSNPYQNPYQSILVSQSDITTSSDGNVKIPLQYDISDKNNAVTGLGLQIHYNSSAVNPTGDITSGLTGLFSTNIFGTPSIIDDSNNLDSDDDTDKIIQINWVDIAGNWPSTDLPLSIGDLNFTRVDESIESNINFTSLDSEIDSNDNREIKTGIDFSSEIIYTALADGTMYLEAGGSEDKWQGIYNILASDLGNLDTDDHPSTLDDSDPLVIIAGQQRTGVIETTDDLDLFTLNLKGSQHYQISVRGEVGNGGSLPDPRFRLLDKDGNAVAAAFDGIANPDASLNIKVINDGKYYLEVSADRKENENSALDFGDAIDVSSSNIGSYTAELTEVVNYSEDDQVESNKNTNEKLILGESFVGKLVEANDVDWVSVDLTEGELYIFDAKPRIVNKIGAWNPALELINSDGNRIDLDLDSGEGDAARITYRASSTGTFYLSTRSQDGTYGTYELSKKLLESGSTDPYEIYQWHLSNKNGLDLNIQSVWKDVSGEGILVGVIDDGINYKHPDLNDNLDFIRDKGESWNCITGMGVVYQDANLRVAPKPERGHGTAVAGVIAAEKNNQAGVVGVAYDSKVAGFEVDWSTKSIASMLRSQVRLDIGGMDVTNNSWGFTSPFGDDFDSPLMEPLGESLEYGVDEGRYIEEVDSNGETVGTYYGLNWVFAAGNSRSKGDNTNYHNFQNSRYVTTVAATNSYGQTSKFSTPGASILVSAFGEDVFTTCLNCAGPNDPNGYGNFSGTSAAAPVVSGVIALMLEANKKLGYRDVQNILAYSARQEISEGFKFNGANNWNGGGLHISHDQGFGLVDAHAAVRLAESWDRPAQVAANEQMVVRRLNNSGAIPDNDTSGISFSTSIERDLDVEWAEVELDIRHERIADLVVEIVSPSGTVSRLIDRPTTAPSNPEGIYGPYSGMPDRIIYTTSSSLFRGESSLGNWTLRVSDQNAEISGELRQWGIKLYGQEANNDDIYIFTDEYQKVADANRSALYDVEGHDCINAAAVTSACFIDLNDGAASQIGLSEFLIAENVLIEDVFTGDGNDFLTGNEKNNSLNAGRGNDRFIASGGDDYIDGGFGYDEIIYDANYADFELLQVGNLWNLVDKRSTDIGLHYGRETFKSIEKLVFNDQDYELNLTNSQPVLASPIPDISYGSDVIFDYIFDSGTFTDEDVDNGSGDSLGYTLKMADGKDLPGWLNFDRNQIKLTGEPYPAISGVYDLELKATDIFGASAEDQFSLTIAGTSSDTNEPEAEKRVEWDFEVINQEEEAQKVVNVGDSFEISIKASDISDVNPHSVFSAYTDLHYDSSLIKAVSINYDENFSQINSGTIDNSQGLIADLGANLSSFQSVPDPSMLTVTFEVLKPGVGDISLRPNQSEYLETTIFGFDGDQRAYSKYISESITFNAPDPDIAVSSFDIKANKIASGIADISYQLSNFGQVDSKEFYLKIYHSDDNELDKDNDKQIFNKLFADGEIAGEGATDVITGELQVPVADLYLNARAEDVIGPELGKTSSSKDWLFMDIEPVTEDADSISTNNTKSLEVTYFPWDIDGNGRVTSVDAITMVNNIGDAPLVNGVTSIYDLNGDGIVDQIEVMDIVQRIGLQVNNDVNAIA